MILLLFALASVLAANHTSVTVTFDITRTGNNNNNYKYTLTLRGLNPSNGITLSYSTTGEYGPYTQIEIGETFLTDVPHNTKIYLLLSDSSYPSKNPKEYTVNSTGNSAKQFTMTTDDTSGLAEEARLYYFPRNVVDNSNVMVDLSSAKQMTASSFSTTFSNYTDQNLALFRIRESLLSQTVGNGQSGTLTNSLKIRIESLDGWAFINEYNSTRTTTYSLDAFCLEEKLKYTDLGGGKKKTEYTPSAPIALGDTTMLTPSGNSATFRRIGDYYELELPYTYFEKGTGRFYPEYIRNADVCLNIPEFGSGLEPGYYTTRLLVTIPEHEEVGVNMVPTPVGEKSFIITVRGYLGVEANSSGSSSFYVLSMGDTYSMDLGIASNPAQGYSIAEAKFSYFDVVFGPEGDKNADPRPANAETKFTIYISPTSDYTDTITPFRFIKIGSERQARSDDNTIYFRLAWDSNNSSYDNQSSGRLYMRPKYTSTRISSTSSGGSGRNSYQIKWDMDNIIKLYLTDSSLQTYTYHQEGMYYSYIYFTLVTNN